MRFNFKMRPSFILWIISLQHSRTWCRHATLLPQTGSFKQANISKRREHSRSYKMRSTSFPQPFINIMVTQALTCARPRFSCTEVAVSVTSTDLLLSSVRRPQIMAANNSWKEKTVSFLATMENKEDQVRLAFLIMKKEFNFIHSAFVALCI